jgi:RimJ/RimL family protein N-acetyltransferase
MEKLAMRRVKIFDHPRVPEGHALRPHLLYEITRDEWVTDRMGG